MKKSYKTLNALDFFVIGRIDALSDGKKIIEELKKELEDVPNDIKINNLKNYLLGYKIGLLEYRLQAFNITTSFNSIDKTISYYEGSTLRTISFEKGYASLEEEASKEVKELLYIK